MNYGGYGNSGNMNSYGQYPQMNYGQMSYAQMPGQSYGTAQGQGIDWVDGEAAARAMQLPAGVSQHAMWDINEPVIYLKSVNQMGMPNPLRKIRYTIEDSSQSGAGQRETLLTSGDGTDRDMSQYVRKDEAERFVKKDDLERMKNELMESIQGISAATGTARRTAKGE